MNYSAQDIFSTGEQFYAASIVLNKQLLVTEHFHLYIPPLNTNLALSIELYLKCLYIIDKNEYPSRNHNLGDIYSKLNEKTKTCINELYNELVLNDKDLENLESELLEIDAALNQASRSFINWRYNHENKYGSFLTGDILSLVLRYYILMNNSDWEDEKMKEFLQQYQSFVKLRDPSKPMIHQVKN